jgi:MFS superfamily sulfate permease-like transporter
MASVGYAVWARVEHTVPALRWIPHYVAGKWRGWLIHDIVASLALAALAAPEAISYASIAGMPGVNGLYSAYTAPLAYAIFGSSPQLVTGPTTLMSVLTLDAMEGTGTWAGKRLVPETPIYFEVAAFLAVIVGLQQILLALVGGASLTALLSAPIISGFTTGSALIIGASQLAKIFGVPKCIGTNGGSCSIQAAIANVVNHFPGMYWQTPVLSLSCVAFLVLWKYALPRFLPRYLRILGNAAPLLLMIFTGAWGSGKCLAVLGRTV